VFVVPKAVQAGIKSGVDKIVERAKQIPSLAKETYDSVRNSSFSQLASKAGTSVEDYLHSSRGKPIVEGARNAVSAEQKVA